VKVVGIALQEYGYENFKKLKLFKHELYINPGKTIYKALGYKKPGLLACFGFCMKNLFKRINQAKEKYKDKNISNSLNIKSDNSQLGGSLLITPEGQVIFKYVEGFIGDHAKEEDVIEAIVNYYDKTGLYKN
jgi:hypothetical protein